MTFFSRVALLAALALLVASGVGATTEGASAPKAPRLVAFGSCGELLRHVKAQAGRFVGPYGFGALGAPGMEKGVPTQAAAPTQGVDYSGTNVQEEGVDEPDLVKTDGETLYSVASGRLNAVDVRERRPRLLDSLKLQEGLSHELLLHGSRLLVLSRGGFWIQPLPAMTARIMPPAPAQSVLTEIDVSNPKALRLVRTLTLDGSYVAARLVGGKARIVTASQLPVKLPFVQPKGSTEQALAEATKRNKAVVSSSRAASWLPSYRVKRPGRPASEVPPFRWTG